MIPLKKYSVSFSGGPLNGMQVERLTLPDVIRIPSTGRGLGVEIASYRKTLEAEDSISVIYAFYDPEAES